jgi:hypothetical protein
LIRPPMRQSCNVTLVVLGRSAPSSVKIETLDQILRELLKPVLRSNLLSFVSSVIPASHT